MECSSLDILVHPGFGALIGMPENKSQELILDRYRERIEEISQDTQRMLIAILYMPEVIKAENASLQVQSIANLISETKELLQDRYLEISSKYVMSEIDPDQQVCGPFYDDLKLQLSARGVFVKPDMSVYAWGQTIGSCVPNVAANFHEQYNLAENNPVKIPIFYTNRGVSDEEIDENSIQRYLSSYSERVQGRILLTVH